MLSLVPALLAVTALGAPVRAPTPERPPAHVLEVASVGGVGGVALTSTRHRVEPSPAGPTVTSSGPRELARGALLVASATHAPAALAAVDRPWPDLDGRRLGPPRPRVTVAREVRAAPWRPG